MDKDTRFYIKHGVTYYWVFLIGIYSGMRTEEICKLRADELKREDVGLVRVSQVAGSSSRITLLRI